MPKATRAAPLMRGAVALPWSKTPSRTKGSCRNLGDLAPPAVVSAIPGHDRKSMRRKLSGKARGVGRLRSTCAASNKADEHSVAESVEGRRPVGSKASGDARPGHRARVGVSQKLRAYEPAEPLRRAGCVRLPTGAHCGKGARWDLCGGTGATRFPTAT